MNRMDTANVRDFAHGSDLAQPAKPLARFRLTLRAGETYTLSSSPCEVHILSGVACILKDGRKMSLMAGETRAFTVEQRGSVLGDFGDELLIVEIALGAASDEAQRLKRQFYERMAARQQCMLTERQRER